MQSLEGKQYLSVKDSANTDNADLVISSFANADSHKFKLLSNGDGTFKILTKASNYTKCLDGLPGSSTDTSDGSDLKQYTTASEDKAQNWLLYSSDSASQKIITSAQYTSNKNFPYSVTDAAGNKTYYNYENSTGNLTGTTDAKGNITSYTYDQSTDNLLSVTAGGTTNSYTYSKDRLDKINTTNGTGYKFTYDSFGRTTAIQVGNGTTYSNLSTMEYNSAGLLSKQTYGNGNYVNFYYDSLDRLTEKVYNGDSNKKITYYYGNDGRVSHSIDYMANTNTRYVYDLAGRVVKAQVFSGTSLKNVEPKESVIYNYADKTNYITSVTYTSALGTQTVSYGYGSLASGTMPDTVYTVSQNGTQHISYSFDDLARLSSRTISPINKTQTYTYKQGGHGTNSTTTQVASVTVDGVTTSYTYDAVGNITAIYENNQLYESYEYDALSQLTKVTTADGDVYQYTYDKNGNITSAEMNGRKSVYSYGNGTWKDLLTGYSGETITYDNIGNPLNYRNGMTFTWQNGRQLSGVTKGTKSISYTYNAEGLRTSKTVNGTTTNYTYIDGRLIGEKTGNDIIIFLYDESGNIYGLTHNGTAYYYKFNLQGDVIGIYDDAGNIIVEYTYDAWGKIISVRGAYPTVIAGLNPIRYRGYYYDEETGFYYLQSRYYDAEIGRFVNADGYVSTGQGVLANNMFAYCGNNPVNRVDPTGMFWKEIGDFFSNVWNGIKTWAKNTFGAENSTTATFESDVNEILPDPLPITVKTNAYNTSTVSKSGNSSKPVSVYSNIDFCNTESSINGGVKINISSFTLDINAGTKGLGICGSSTNGNKEKSFGIIVNLNTNRIEGNYSSAIIWDNNSSGTKTTIGINMLYFVALFVKVPVGQSQGIPAPAY